MQKLHNLLKNKTSASDVEIIVWFTVLFVIATILFLFRPSNLKGELVDNSTTIEQTIVNTEPIDHSNVSNNIINNEEYIKSEKKEPIVQNVTINNIVKDKDDNFWANFNINLLSDFTATVLVGILSFFAGMFMKNRRSKKLKQLDKE